MAGGTMAVLITPDILTGREISQNNHVIDIPGVVLPAAKTASLNRNELIKILILTCPSFSLIYIYIVWAGLNNGSLSLEMDPNNKCTVCVRRSRGVDNSAP